MTNADRIRRMTDDELHRFIGILKHWLESDAHSPDGLNTYQWFKGGEQE